MQLNELWCSIITATEAMWILELACGRVKGTPKERTLELKLEWKAIDWHMSFRGHSNKESNVDKKKKKEICDKTELKAI